MKSKTRNGVSLVALALALAVAAPVYAAVTGLTATPTAARYGQEVVLQPTVDGTTTTTFTGDKFEPQLYTGGSWEPYGEMMLVEETGTIDPLYVQINHEIAWPAQFRILYRPAASKGATDSISDTVTVSAIKNTRTRVAITAPRTAREFKTVTISGRVVPDSGRGYMTISVMRVKGSKEYAVKRLKLHTDEFGFVSARVKLARAGTYRIRMKWLGNSAFGTPSPTALRTMKVVY